MRISSVFWQPLRPVTPLPTGLLSTPFTNWGSPLTWRQPPPRLHEAVLSGLPGVGHLSPLGIRSISLRG